MSMQLSASITVFPIEPCPAGTMDALRGVLEIAEHVDPAEAAPDQSTAYSYRAYLADAQAILKLAEALQ